VVSLGCRTNLQVTWPVYFGEPLPRPKWAIFHRVALPFFKALPVSQRDSCSDQPKCCSSLSRISTSTRIRLALPLNQWVQGQAGTPIPRPSLLKVNHLLFALLYPFLTFHLSVSDLQLLRPSGDFLVHLFPDLRPLELRGDLIPKDEDCGTSRLVDGALGLVMRPREPRNLLGTMAGTYCSCALRSSGRCLQGYDSRSPDRRNRLLG
jgi:hypothetical protein